MTMSIGITYTGDEWKTCLCENEQILELCTFVNSNAMLDYIIRICSFYPEPIIAFSSMLETPLCSLQSVVIPPEMSNLHTFITAVTSITTKNFHLPAVKYLQSVPSYRKHRRKDLGNANTLCTVATLLYRMRQQEALWSEMRFLFLELGENDRSIVVVKDGQLVDGMTVRIEVDEEEDKQEHEQEYWEGLMEDVAGLMAIHHFDDIVFIDHRSSRQDVSDTTTVVDRLGDTYQFYLFPYNESEPRGFEAVIGASLIAQGLFHPGLAAEVVERLQIR